MKKIDELTNPQSCLSRAADDEILFVLMARDPEAADIIREWSRRRVLHCWNAEGDAQIKEALRCADDMDEQRRAGIKRPENPVAPWGDSEAHRILDRVKAVILKEQGHDRYHHTGTSTDAALELTLAHKRELVARVVQHSRQFQEDVLTFLRAFELMLETVAGASTHGEKAARLRGLMELVSTAAGKIRERQFAEEDSWSYGVTDDVFRCNYPVRHWQNRCRELEEKVRILESKKSGGQENPGTDSPLSQEPDGSHESDRKSQRLAFDNMPY